MKPFHIADRYARSAFELAEEQGQGETLASEIDVVAQAMGQNPRFLNLLENPLVSREEKRALIEQVLDNKLSSLAKRFLTLLVEKGRIDLFQTIAEQLHDKFNGQRGIQEATVVTARALDAKGAEQLEKALEKMTSKKMLLRFQIESHLLGGVQIRLGNRLLDGSLRTKLTELHAHLKTAKV